MVRSPEYEVTRSFQDITAREVFQEIESALRVRDIAWCEHGQDTELLDRIDSCLIPSAIMHCVDVLLREGILPTVIRRELKKNGYQKLLKAGKYTPPVLKKKISHWKSRSILMKQNNLAPHRSPCEKGGAFLSTWKGILWEKWR